MSLFVVKSRPEQKRQFPLLIHIVSMIPGVKNWYIDNAEDLDLLKIEVSDDIDQNKLHSLLNLYEIKVEVQA